MDSNVPTLVHQVDRLGKLYSQKGESNSQIRRELRVAVSKLGVTLETQEDIIERFTYMPMNTSLIRIAIDLGIFTLLIKKNAPMSAKELSQATNADHLMVIRVLRSLAAVHILNEVDVETYTSGKIAETFATAKGSSTLKSFYDCMHYAWHELPSFLAEIEYRNPADGRNTALQKGLHTQDALFDWIFKRPAYLAGFNEFMRTQRAARAKWLDFYPLGEEFQQCSGERDAVTFVDIGGSLGHEIQEIKRRYSDAPGRMILQDVQANTDQVTSIEAMPHDFFTPQPVKGSRIYYFRNVFHDWPDDRCRLILEHTRDAMTKGYSKILINEFVVPERGASAFMTHIDINMMSILAAMERTEKQWRDLVESAGLKVQKIWPTVEDSEAVIEVTLA